MQTHKILIWIFGILFLLISGILYIDWQKTLAKTNPDTNSIFSSSYFDNIGNITFLQDVYPVEKITSKDKLNIDINEYKKFVSMYKDLNDKQKKELGIWNYNPDKNIKQNIIIKPTIYDYVKSINNK